MLCFNFIPSYLSNLRSYLLEKISQFQDPSKHTSCHNHFGDLCSQIWAWGRTRWRERAFCRGLLVLYWIRWPSSQSSSRRKCVQWSREDKTGKLFGWLTFSWRSTLRGWTFPGGRVRIWLGRTGESLSRGFCRCTRSASQESHSGSSWYSWKTLWRSY